MDNVVNAMPQLDQCCTKGTCVSKQSVLSSAPGSANSSARQTACDAIGQPNPTKGPPSSGSGPGCGFNSTVNQITQIDRISGRLPHCTNIVIGAGELSCPSYGCCNFDGFSSIVAKEFMKITNIVTKAERNAFMWFLLGDEVNETVTFKTVKRAVSNTITAKCNATQTSNTQTIANSAITFGVSSNVNCDSMNIALNKMGASIQCALGQIAEAKKAAAPSSVGPLLPNPPKMNFAAVMSIVVASVVVLILISFFAFRAIRSSRDQRMLHQSRVLEASLTDKVDTNQRFTMTDDAVDALLQSSSH